MRALTCSANRMRPTISWRGMILGLTILGLVSACATRDSGYKISEETIAFIKPGATSRSEVIENLGPPLLELKDPPVVAYSWGKMRVAGGARASANDDPMLRADRTGTAIIPPTGEQSELVETRRWICCIALDQKDQVTRVERVELPGAGSLEQAVRAWAASKP